MGTLSRAGAAYDTASHEAFGKRVREVDFSRGGRDNWPAAKVDETMERRVGQPVRESSRSQNTTTSARELSDVQRIRTTRYMHAM